MKLFSFKIHWAIVALIAILPAVQTHAQTDMELQPGVVISLSSIDEHLNDVEYLVEAAGFVQMKALVRMGASEYLRGLDTSKPIGSLLFFEESSPEPKVLAFIPVEDIDEVLDTIAPFVTIDDSDDDVILITTDDGTEFSILEKNGYAFVTDDKSLLKKLPSSPLALLEDMHGTYNIAAKVFGQRIPESLRSQAIDLIRDGYEQSLNEAPEDLAELQRKNFEFSMKSIESFINETDNVVAGLAIDQDEKKIYIDVRMTGLPGSKFAKQSEAMRDSPSSKFTGFLVDGAAMTFHVCSKLLDDDIPQMEEMIDELRKAAFEGIENEMEGEPAEFIKEIVNELIDGVKDTVREGVIDSGGTINLDENTGEFAIGMRVADGRKFESSVKKIGKIAEMESDVPLEFKFDVETKDGVTFHEVVIKIPAEEEEAREFFGEKLDMVIGVADKAIYVAGGKNPRALLDKAMSGSQTGDMPMAQYNVHVAPILRFISRIQDDEQMETMAQALSDSGNDRIRIYGDVIENGQKFRIEFEDGFLKMMGAAAQQFGGGFGPPQDF